MGGCGYSIDEHGSGQGGLTGRLSWQLWLVTLHRRNVWLGAWDIIRDELEPAVTHTICGFGNTIFYISSSSNL